MGTRLFKNLTIATCDAQDTVLQEANLLVEDNHIAFIGQQLPMAEQIIDCSGCIAIPGLINGHHHLFQTLTRGLPVAQNVGLFAWLVNQYPIWAQLTPPMLYSSAQIGLAELLLSGCTTASDMFYLFPRQSGVKLDYVIQAAQELGIRLYAGRGSMSKGQSSGGLPPDEVIQGTDEILADTERLLSSYHEPEPAGMIRISVMPCSPFSVTDELMRDSLALARQERLLVQTHLAETLDEERYCLERFGKRPLAYLSELEWLGPDVSFAHGIHLDTAEIRLLGETGTGIVHCPSSNMRLASGIAPVVDLLAAGATVGVGVDGSASNDSGNLLLELRQALLVGRLRSGPTFSARSALALATSQGAKLLNRPEIGSLAVGKLADLAIFDLKRLEYAGAACHDPVAALLLCQPTPPRYVLVNGRVVVADGRLLTIDLERAVAEHNRLVIKLQESIAGAIA
ncbi:MAG: 8-oxoguanine deaminase [Cyanobacteria bacterium NC_groundwater_1444_Ag_S-0.65um_54_12]|nr:8-oxoguanine deaminase [Cyanobacteria bacterium NC_groundwater_1444_Ag_S-0.65um_54_12]